LCDYYRIDFRPLFVNSWDFGFNNNESILEKQIDFNSNFDWCLECFKISKTYFNMSFIPINNIEIDIMNSLRDGKIILLQADAYNLPWNLAFLKYHSHHYFIAKFDFDNNLISVTDSFCSEKKIELPSLDGLNILECRIVQLLGNGQDETTPILLRAGYHIIMESNIHNNIFNSIRHFGDELEKIDSIEKLTKCTDDLTHSIFLRKLKNISDERYNVKCFFEYIQLSNKYVDSMGVIYNKWKTIETMFVKILVSKKLNSITRIREEIYFVAKLENDLCNAIIEEKNNANT